MGTRIDVNLVGTNKADVASEIRALLEKIVQTKNVVVHLENNTGEDMGFYYTKNTTGRYTVNLFTKETFDTEFKDVIGDIPYLNTLQNLKSLKIDVSVGV